MVWASSAWAGDASPQALPNVLPTTEIAPGVFYHAGAQAEENRENGGDIANIGFIVGSRCVAVIDTGGSPAVGAALRRAVEARTTTPICYVINTHMHPDHVLGNRAFVSDGTRFVGAAGLSRALASRASTYLDRLSESLDVHTDSSWIVLPDQTVSNQMTLDLGERTLRLRAWPTAHTDNDLTVFDEKTGTLWLGDLLFVDRVPSIDGSITGWQSALDKLAARTDIVHAIPGHGPVDGRWPTVLDPEIRYLNAIEHGVREALDHGRGLRWAQDHVAQDERDRWLLFDEYNPRNVTAAYTELEWQ
ncbi:quinoprotein relay system zinc metallohydrolase 2 [Salinisphaera sp. T31B1]|uniref:quinoprotein relay system zinc metallohydrolase 2 n=1 Tax=Salinisphaera sp. T31B1 TaxID=727963 RepID=UPI00334134D8